MRDDDWDDKRFTGRSKEVESPPSLEAAVEAAWEAAKNAGEEGGTYDVKIQIEADNPIRAYVVTITPSG